MFTTTNLVKAALARNPYGMSATALAFCLCLDLKDVKAALKALLVSKEIVSEKVAKNAEMFALPYTCMWSTRAAELAGIART